MTIQIPKDISEVTPQLCRQVFTDICGGRIVTSHRERRNESGVWKIGNIRYYSFRPFTRIQDTKLCDRWLVENKLVTRLEFNRHGKCAVWIFKNTDIHSKIGYEYDMSEPFARMVAIILAFNKLEEK